MLHVRVRRVLPFLMLVVMLVGCNETAKSPTTLDANVGKFIDVETPSLELDIIDAVGNEFPVGVKFDTENYRIVLTIFATSTELNEPRLQDYKHRAEALAKGIPVFIEVNEGGAPVLE
jgi:hypothetical protein